MIIPEAPLDILAQQIVRLCSAEDWEEEVFTNCCAVRIPIATFPRDDFDESSTMLAEGIAAQRGRYGAYLHRDQINGNLRARRGARLAAITSGGAIPDNALSPWLPSPKAPCRNAR